MSLDRCTNGNMLNGVERGFHAIPQLDLGSDDFQWPSQLLIEQYKIPSLTVVGISFFHLR